MPVHVCSSVLMAEGHHRLPKDITNIQVRISSVVQGLGLRRCHTLKKYEKTCPNHGVKLFCPALKPQSGPTRACQKQWARGWNKKSKPRPDCRLLWRLQSHPLSQTHLKESYFKPGTSEYPCFLHLIWSGCLWGMRIIGFFNKKITHFFKHLKAS